MRKAVVVIVAAVATSAGAWWAGTQQSSMIALGESRTAAGAESARSDGADPQPPAAASEQVPVQESPPLAAPEIEPPAPVAQADYGLPADLRASLQSYRSAPTVAEREDSLLDLALSDEPGVLDFLLDELRSASVSKRAQVLAALSQYGSRKAIPELRRLAELAESPSERRALLDTADNLALPTYTEYRQGLLSPGSRR